jgi:hypothetical protein
MNPETSLDAAEAELLALLRGEDAHGVLAVHRMSKRPLGGAVHDAGKRAECH